MRKGLAIMEAHHQAWREKVAAANKAHLEAKAEAAAHNAHLEAEAEAHRQANRKKPTAADLIYRQANREKTNQRNRLRRQANREKENERNRIYHHANRERLRAANKAWCEANKQRRKDQCTQYRLMKKYGIGQATVTALLEAQDNRCAICKTSFTYTRSYIDHCHINGHVRGILCNLCNSGIAYFHDNPKFLRAAIKYLNTPPTLAAAAAVSGPKKAGK